MKEKHTLVLIYNSFKDPLFQNLILEYITRLGKTNHLKFHLVTFEQPQFEMNDFEINSTKRKLAEQNIFWSPLRFHTGKAILFKKMWDIWQVLWLARQIQRKYNLAYILAFANVSAAISSILAVLFHVKLLIYSYEPHAQFMAEMGLWSPKGFKFKILNFFEVLAAKKAHHVITGTNAMKSDLLKRFPTLDISVAPTAVNHKDFYFSLTDRERVRNALGINESQKILLYIGKFGGLYFDVEIVDLLITISQWDQNYIPMIISDYDKDEISGWYKSKGGDCSKLILKNSIDRQEVKAYLSAADIGIIGIPPLPFQKYRSPTKTAEFMLCGLPYIVCRGVSEDGVYAKKHSLGCVVDGFSKTDLLKKKEEIIEYLNVNKEEFSTKSRSVALEYRSLDRVHAIFEKLYKD